MKSILFVDDEKDILDELKKTFKGTDWITYYASSANEAMEILSRNKINMLAADINLKGVTGIQLLKQVKQQYPLIVRLVLIDKGDEDLVFKAFQGNLCRYYLEKPWNNTRLIKVMEKINELYEKLTSKELLLTVNSLEKLPMLPDTYYELNQLIDDDGDISDIIKVIEKDASVTLKILHMANSAFCGVKTGDIKTAVLNLGFINIRNIIFASTVFDFFDDNSERKKMLWKHAFISNNLVIGIYSSLLKRPIPVMYSAAGMLHDIGKMILCRNFSSNYMKVFDYVKDYGVTFTEAEREILDKDHSEVGAYLLDWWSIPIPVVNSALYHEKPLEAGEVDRELVAVVHIASYYAWKNLNFPAKEVLDESVFESLGFSKESCEIEVRKILENTIVD